MPLAISNLPSRTLVIALTVPLMVPLTLELLFNDKVAAFLMLTLPVIVLPASILKEAVLVPSPIVVVVALMLFLEERPEVPVMFRAAIPLVEPIVALMALVPVELVLSRVTVPT